MRAEPEKVPTVSRTDDDYVTWAAMEAAESARAVMAKATAAKTWWGVEHTCSKALARALIRELGDSAGFDVLRIILDELAAANESVPASIAEEIAGRLIAFAEAQRTGRGFPPANPDAELE